MSVEDISLRGVPVSYNPRVQDSGNIDGNQAKNKQDFSKLAKSIEDELVLVRPIAAGRVNKTPTTSPGLLGRIGSAIKRIFVKEKLTPAEIVKNHVASTPSKIANQRTHISGLSASASLLISSSKLMQVSENLFLSAQEKKSKIKDKSLTAKNAVAQKELYQQVAPFSIKVGKEEASLTGYAIKSDGYLLDVKENQVIPTSFALGGEDSSHLTNCYVIKIGEYSTIIRTGVIDTERKANEFYTILKKLHDESPLSSDGSKTKLRVISQQLNSHETEKKLIQNQHRMIATLNSRMQQSGIGEIAHINTPTNRFYHFTKFVRSVPLIGSWIENKYFYGEKASKEQNIEAWGSYLKWIGEDLKDALPDLKKHSFLKEHTLKPIEDFVTNATNPANDIYRLQKEIETNIRSIGYMDQRIKSGSGDIKGAVKQRKEFEKQLKENRENLKSKLKDQFSSIASLDTLIDQRFSVIDNQLHLVKTYTKITDNLNALHAERKDLLKSKEKISLMKDILADQLEIPNTKRLGRGRLEMSLQLINSLLGVTSAINCKSGLDRTGFLFSVRIGLEQMIKRTQSTSAIPDLVQHWGTVSREMNQRISKDGLDNFNKWLKAPDKNSAETQLKGQMLLAIEFRKSVLDNLIRFGLPITGISTGVPGLKWHKGMQENLIPLNFLPPFVEIISASGQSKKVALVNYDKTGKPEGLSKYGHDLLGHLSSMRGS